jgi:hypothetical protein
MYCTVLTVPWVTGTQAFTTATKLTVRQWALLSLPADNNHDLDQRSCALAYSRHITQPKTHTSQLFALASQSSQHAEPFSDCGSTHISCTICHSRHSCRHSSVNRFLRRLLSGHYHRGCVWVGHEAGHALSRSSPKTNAERHTAPCRINSRIGTSCALYQYTPTLCRA